MELEYTIDKVAFKLLVNEAHFHNIVTRFRYIDIDDRGDVNMKFIGEIQYWETLYIKSYRYNWKHTDLDGSVCYIGYCHNSEKLNRTRHKLYVEYNPNKYHGFLLGDLIKPLLRSQNIKLVDEKELYSIDVAVDIKDVNINDLIVDKGTKKYVNYIEDNGTPTRYYGKGDGKVKIYNKRAERLKKGIDIGQELTRYEITLEPHIPIRLINNIAICEDNLPKVYHFKNNLTIAAEEKLLLLGLTLAPELLSKLSRRKKEKIKNIMETQEKISINEKEVKNCILNFINGIIQ